MYNLNIEYEWDTSKAQDNLEKHGIDFSDIAFFDWRTSVNERSDRQGEVRFISIGYIGDHLHVVIHTTRGEATRIISLRQANARERSRYAQANV